MTLNPTIAISSWALHGLLGAPPILGPQHVSQDIVDVSSTKKGDAGLSLLEVPAALASRGYHTMEICHFHLPSREVSYLSELRVALHEANVNLLSLLVDEGDLTHPEHGQRDLEWIGGWIPVAAQLGAQRMRVIAGKTNVDGALDNVVVSLRSLAAQAQAVGVRLTTENWFDVTATPTNLLHILDETHGEVGLNLDFGNWGGQTKYDDLAQIASRAETCHAQAHFTGPNVVDTTDFRRILDILSRVGFKGAFTLVAAGPGPNPWDGLETTAQFIREFASS